VGNVANGEQLGLTDESAADLVGERILVDFKRGAALLPRPTQPNHANYPPQITFRFYLYGRVFEVSHSFRRERRRNGPEVEEFSIGIDRELSYFKRKRVEALCQEAIASHLGTDYFGHKFEVTSQPVNVAHGKKEVRR
jgi:hypothetical protein